VADRTGRIWLVEDGVRREEPFLDLSAKVDLQREGGLTGLAFPDDFAASGRFFVYYQEGLPDVDDDEMTSIVSSFQVAGPPAEAQGADPASEQVLFSLAQPSPIHHGGTIAIRDGWLYLALGDGGGAPESAGSYDPADEAQRDGSPFGKLLRLDLSLPAPANADWETFAKGLRNPFRFSFDRLTGDLYLGDVGQARREEIHFLPADAPPGANFGWDVLEGSLCIDDPDGFDPDEPACDDPSLLLPVFEYEHAGPCNAVTGGYVYRGSRVPALAGRYLFADYCVDAIWSLRREQAGWAFEDLTADLMPDPPVTGIAGFGEDGFGELYVTSLRTGRLYRVPAPAATPGGTTAVATLAWAARRRRAR